MHFHANPLEHTEYFKNRLGQEAFEKLRWQAETIVKIDRKLIKLDLKQELEKIRRLENGHIVQ